MKKTTLLLTLATSTLLLASCGKVTAQFPTGDDPLTNTAENIQIDHNTLDVIYDLIKNSDNYESDVSAILNDSIAREVIGNFELQSDETNGYKIVLVGYDDVDESGKTRFIETHPAYNNWEVSGYRLTLSETAPSKEDFETRLNSIKNIIDSQVVSTLWGEANATNYKRNNRFYEILFARNIYEQLYNVALPLQEGETIEGNLYDENPTYEEHYDYDSGNGEFIGFKETSDFHGLTNGVLIDGSYNTTSAEGRNKIKDVLHIEYYLDYINSTIMPDIIQNLLVEQYIFEQQYSAIGNTQSRKVNYITIADNSEKDASSLINEFVGNYVINAADNSLTTDQQYDILSTAWKGVHYKIAESEAAQTLAQHAFNNPTAKNPSAGLDGHLQLDKENPDKFVNSYYQSYGTLEANEKYFTYYENSEYADLIEQYSTLTNDSATNNSTNFTTFTAIDSYNYDPIVGFTIKTDEILIEDFTTAGWQTRDDSSLSDTLKNSLYSFGLVNDWNNSRNAEGNFYGNYIYKNKATGKSYLRKDSYDSESDALIWEDGTNYYLVEIEDIVTPNLVSISADDSKDVKVARENKARTIGYTLASGDTYTTNAITYYLKQCNINYHDQDIYDYFNSTYPDLFE